MLFREFFKIEKHANLQQIEYILPVNLIKPIF